MKLSVLKMLCNLLRVTSPGQACQPFELWLVLPASTIPNFIHLPFNSASVSAMH